MSLGHARQARIPVAQRLLAPPSELLLALLRGSKSASTTERTGYMSHPVQPH